MPAYFDIETIREAFEAEMRKCGMFEQGGEAMAIDEETGGYSDPNTSAMWTGFSLGWRAAHQANA